MKYSKSLAFTILAAALALASCSGLPKGAGGGGGGGGNNNGNEFLNVTITSTPSTAFYFPSLVFQVSNISLVNSAGTAVSIGGGFGSPPMAFSQMQTNSIYLGSLANLGATSYTKLQFQYATPYFSDFYNGTNGTLFSCATGAVCLIPNTVVGYGATTVTVPITYTATGNTKAGIRINFDLSKAVTTAGGMTFDFTQAGAITISTLPPAATSQTSGLDTADNVTGAVTAKTSTTVTVASFFDEARTFTIATGAVFKDPFTPSVCGVNAPSASCLAVNQNITIDGVINSDGTRTANFIEFLDPAPAVAELEGVITSPLTNGQFKIVTTNGMGSSSILVSDPVLINVNGTESFAVDPKNLTGVSATSTVGFMSESDLVLGQTVMIQGGSFSGVNTSITNPTRIMLRYSSIGGLVETPSGTTFTLSGLSPFFTDLNNQVVVQTYAGVTAYDNISDFSGLVGGTTNASVLGLYLNPNSGAAQPLLAAKIRAH